MLRYYRATPSEYVIVYRKGQPLAEGRGIGFFYSSRTDSVVSVPMNMTDCDFSFSEVTGDIQTVKVSGKVGFQISEPQKTASVFDFTVNPRTRTYLTKDLSKLKGHVVGSVQETVRADIQRMSVEDVLAKRGTISRTLLAGLKQSKYLAGLGVSVAKVFISNIAPKPEVAEDLAVAKAETMMMSTARVGSRSMAAYEPLPQPVEFTIEELPAVECTDTCPFCFICEDYKRHVQDGRAWCPLFRDFKR